MTTLKSGEKRDKFAVCVDNKNGAGEYKGGSGGERQIVNLAISLAFNKMCRSMASGSVNVLFLDEPFESLDETASECAVSLCQQFSKEIENPFIITHNQAIKDVVAHRVKVVKSGGKATVTI